MAKSFKLEILMFTFSSKSRRLTIFAIVSMLLLHKPLHCVGTNPQTSTSSRPAESSSDKVQTPTSSASSSSSSKVEPSSSSSSSKVEPVKKPEQVSSNNDLSKKEVANSELVNSLSQYANRDYRNTEDYNIDNKLLGVYFYRENSDIVDIKTSVDNFVQSKPVTDFVEFLNTILLTQIQQCKSVNKAGQSCTDHHWRAKSFEVFLKKIVSALRPAGMPQHSDRIEPLDQAQWDYVLSSRVPWLQKALADTKYITLDLSGATNTSWLERANQSLDSKPIPQVVTPMYLLKASLKGTHLDNVDTYREATKEGQTSVLDSARKIVNSFNQIAEYNVQFYHPEKNSSPDEYKRKYRDLFNNIVALMKSAAESGVRDIEVAKQDYRDTLDALYDMIESLYTSWQDGDGDAPGHHIPKFSLLNTGLRMLVDPLLALEPSRMITDPGSFFSVERFFNDNLSNVRGH